MSFVRLRKRDKSNKQIGGLSAERLPSICVKRLYEKDVHIRKKIQSFLRVRDADVCNRSEIRCCALRKHLAQIRSGI